MSEEKRVWKLDDAELEKLLDEVLDPRAGEAAAGVLVERIVGRTRLDVERLRSVRRTNAVRRWALAAGVLLGATAGAWFWSGGVNQQTAPAPMAGTLDKELDQRLAVVLGDATERATPAAATAGEGATASGTREEASLAWLSGVSETVSEVSGESDGGVWGTWVAEGEVGKF